MTKEKQDKEKCYNVSRYFDTYFEAVVASNLTKEDADTKAIELNNKKPRAYVKYIVRRQNQ